MCSPDSFPRCCVVMGYFACQGACFSPLGIFLSQEGVLQKLLAAGPPERLLVQKCLRYRLEHCQRLTPALGACGADAAPAEWQHCHRTKAQLYITRAMADPFCRGVHSRKGREQCRD